jgi:hypothetical protein
MSRTRESPAAQGPSAAERWREGEREREKERVCVSVSEMCHELYNLLRHRPSAAARERQRQEREREMERKRERKRVGGMDRGRERGGRGGRGGEERCVANSRIRCIRCGGCMYEVRRHQACQQLRSATYLTRRVSIRQRTSAYVSVSDVSVCQHTSEYVSIRQLLT